MKTQLHFQGSSVYISIKSNIKPNTWFYFTVRFKFIWFIALDPYVYENLFSETNWKIN